MRSIYFSTNKYRKVFLVATIITVIPYFLGDLGDIELFPYASIISHAVFLLITLVNFIRPLFFKNLVETNKNYMHIKVNTWFGFVLIYQNIVSVVKEDHFIVITLVDGKEKTIDITHIKKEDTEKLYHLLLEKVPAIS